MAEKTVFEKLDRIQRAEYERQLEILSFGVVEITPQKEFETMLAHSILGDKPLRVKCGIDPTTSNVHLGHLVPYKKMRQFQDLGHIGVVIIGDYTASIGDPSGKTESRPALELETINQNAKLYMDQVFTVVDRDRTEVCFQSEWFAEKSLRDVLGWAAQTTVAKLISHDTFRDRLDKGNPLSLHEMFYPVLQGMDSVFVNADVELGGSDQKFNVLMGRDYQKSRDQRPQVAILLPLIMGTCGSQKMSKSLGNSIDILSEPFDKFGKLMSIPDELMLEYFKYLTTISASDFEKIENGLKNGDLHPNETKKELASKIVSFFHGEGQGDAMRVKFEEVFKKGGVPEDTLEHKIVEGTSIVDVLVDLGLFASKGEIRRLIKQNAVGFMDGNKITDQEFTLSSVHSGLVLKMGKRKFLKLK